MKTIQTRVYGAWLYEGHYQDGQDVPALGWKLLRMLEGQYDDAPAGMAPNRDQVLLLMHGETATVITPD